MVDTQIRVQRNVVYGETEQEKLTADIYMPIKGENLPVVLLIHGGAFQSGSKEMYAEWGPYLAQSGFVAMAVNYRLATSKYSTWPSVIDDIHQAANWLVGKCSEFNIDPLKMAVIGDSAGAHIGSIFSFQSQARSSYKIQACVGVYGVYDLTHPGSSREAQMFQKFIGKPIKEASNVYKEASTYHYIEDVISSPTFDTDFFLIWGDSDIVASPSHSENLTKQMQESGLNVKTLVYPGQGHFWFNLTPGLEGGALKDFPNKDVAPKVIQFLKDSVDSSVIGILSKQQIQKLINLQNTKVNAK
ncbi:alpha/beta hydrolase [Neobacillus novalis]|uniref:Alpha/beta hydrolase n=1 Tax=Neobacillus novalis TaxID=220687 RepID=A0AA95MLA6_9BACI|nr:alpha/beta hydrolase [Neobacillus novalis]WHY85786.1 alpha/beta hydrolase [Neobacillus novalis]